MPDPIGHPGEKENAGYGKNLDSRLRGNDTCGTAALGVAIARK